MNTARAASQGARTLASTCLVSPCRSGASARPDSRGRRRSTGPLGVRCARTNGWLPGRRGRTSGAVRAGNLRTHASLHARLALGAALVAVLVAACSSANESASPASTVPPASASATASAETPVPMSPGPGTSTNATPTPSPEGSGTPTAGGAGCTGTAGNRDFFASIAQSVTWNVYCAVLPDGWFIESGNYRLRNQGQMHVAYRGPAGAHFELREGAFCSDPNGCVPTGEASGSASFGDVAGTLFVLDGGGLGLVVDRGAPISWLAIGGNLDEPTFRALTAALHRVD